MGRVPLQVQPVSVRWVLAYRIGRNTPVSIVVDVRPVVAVPIVGYPRQSLPLAERVSVLPIDINMGIGGLRSRIVENGAERSSRNVFGARRVNHVNVEVLLDNVGECVVCVLPVRISGNSVIRGGGGDNGIKNNHLARVGGRGVAIEQKKNGGVVVAGPRKTAYPYVSVVSVVDYVEAGHTTQHIRQRAIAEFLDFLCGDYGYGSGSVGGFLQELRCPVDCVHLEFR